ncbi:MAG: hypothetical protein ACFN3G_07795, partial [Granulicatella adiacens]
KKYVSYCFTNPFPRKDALVIASLIRFRAESRCSLRKNNGLRANESMETDAKFSFEPLLIDRDGNATAQRYFFEY